MRRERGAALHRVTRLLAATVLVAMAAEAQVPGDLSADDMARIVGDGTSQRASMLCTLAARAKEGLSAAQVSAALGPLAGGARWRAVRCLAPKIQRELTGDDLGTLVGEGTAYRDNMLCDLQAHARESITAAEVAAALGPLTGGSRWQAVRCLAPRIQSGLTGDDLIKIVGVGTAYRDNMICDVKGHAREGIAAAEVAAALGPLTGGSRWQAVRCLAPRIQQGLTGDDLVKIVGPGTAYRDNMMCDVKEHAREGITVAEVAVALGPLTGGSRWQAVRCLEPRIQAGMNGLDFAQILGESDSYGANIICDLKAHRAPSLNGAQIELALSGLSGTQRSVALRCLESPVPVGVIGGPRSTSKAPAVSEPPPPNRSTLGSDPASQAYERIRAGDVPTLKELYDALEYILAIEGFKTISDPLLRDKLTQKAGGIFVYTIVIDAFIDLIVEEIDEQNGFGPACPFGAFCDKYVFKSLLTTAKNMTLLNISSALADQVFIVAESWQETKAAFDALPCFYHLSAAEQVELRQLYQIKKLIGSREPEGCQGTW